MKQNTISHKNYNMNKKNYDVVDIVINILLLS